MIWSHWITVETPRVGMYVQIVVQSEITGELFSYEGRVTYSDGTVFSLNDGKPRREEEIDLVLLRWRFRVSPQIRGLLRVEELEDA